MNLTSIREARAARKVTGRHSAERSVMDDIRDADTEGLDIPVPPAQDAAVKAASGPQQVLTWNPPADPLAVARDMTQAMELGYPRSSHPYGPLAQEPGRGTRHAQEWKPPFAETVERGRPYVLAAPLPPEAEVLPSSIGDALNASFPWQDPAQPSEEARLARQRAMSLNYPRPGAGLREHSAFMKRVDEVTGTHGAGKWRVAQLPAGDERWPAMIDALRDAVDTFGDTEQGRAHARLLDRVKAAPNFATAQRLTQVSYEAGITGNVRLFVAETGEPVSSAPEVPQDGTAVTAGEATS
jgi:hypothetical protein